MRAVLQGAGVVLALAGGLAAGAETASVALAGYGTALLGSALVWAGAALWWVREGR